MHNPLFATLLDHYQWQMSLVAGLGVAVTTLVLRLVLRLVPTFRQAELVNKQTYAAKLEKTYYAENQRWNRKWGFIFVVAIFGFILPFCLTGSPQSPLRVVRDIVVILMVYDFIYYFTHRYLFHNGGFLNGPLLWMHAVHHRQHNPCRGDSSYIHPLESAIGLGLYVGTILALSCLMGSFHVATIIITWVAFMEINLHNHDRWEVDTFPFRYLNYTSRLHHNHHMSFTGGNFATISPLYDWMFGTLDHGKGHKGQPKDMKRPSPTTISR